MPRGNLSMTRQHFEAIAETLKGCKPPNDRYTGDAALLQWNRMALDFADMCARSNGGFDRARFLKACGMEE
jgi:hypothetical protein